MLIIDNLLALIMTIETKHFAEKCISIKSCDDIAINEINNIIQNVSYYCEMAALPK